MMDEKAPSSPEPFLGYEVGAAAAAAPSSNPDNGWKKVTYTKRQRRPHQAAASGAAADPDLGRPNGLPSNVFAPVEQKAQERRRALDAASAAAAVSSSAVLARSRAVATASDDDDDDSGVEALAQENGGEVAKKIKQKKPKKPKITVAEAASKIDSADLSAFLADISASFESQQEIQLMRFADYFGRAFSTVSASQFPWTKMFKDSPVAKIVEVPLCYISESVYKTSVDWIAQKSPEALGEFILWCLDGILADLASQQTTGKVSKKSVQLPPSKAQVARFVALAMILRRKPEILISLLPKVKDTKYQGQEKVPVIVWVIAQASQGELVVGMYLWVHYLLPLVYEKSNVNPQSRDLALQLVERMLSVSKARSILLNGAVRKGERLVPPPALDLLMHASFPARSARVKATERFEVVYPTLKELALAGSTGTKTTKQASQQLLTYTIKAMQENNPDLTKEAADVFIWCLAQNADCYRQWEKLYLENIGASVVVLRKLSEDWRACSARLGPPDTLREMLKHLRMKNEEALSDEVHASSHVVIKEADKHCKVVLGKLTRRSSCMKGCVFILAVAIAAGFFMSQSMESLNWKDIHAVIDNLQF